LSQSASRRHAQGEFLLARQVMGERFDAADEIGGVELNVLGFQVLILG
jgi:hypothetical protein